MMIKKINLSLFIMLLICIAGPARSSSFGSMDEEFIYSNQCPVDTPPDAITTRAPEFSKLKDTLIPGCWAQYDTTWSTVCNPNKNQDIMMAKQLIDTLAQGVGMGAAMNIMTACQTMGKMAMAANAAIAAYKVGCGAQQRKCVDMCGEASGQVSNLYKLDKQACDSMDVRTNDTLTPVCRQEYMKQVQWPIPVYSNGFDGVQFVDTDIIRQIPDCAGKAEQARAVLGNIVLGCRMALAGHHNTVIALGGVLEICKPSISSKSHLIYDSAFASGVLGRVYTECRNEYAALDTHMRDPKCATSRLYGKCTTIPELVAQVLPNAMVMGMTMMNAKQCEEYYKEQENNDYCKRFPNDSYCKNGKVDCSKTENKDLRVCICEKNSKDPICGSGDANYGSNKNGKYKSWGSGVSGLGAGDGSGLSDKELEKLANEMGGGMMDKSINPVAGQAGAGDSYPGGGGAGPLGGGGTGGKGPGGGGAAGPGGFKDDMILPTAGGRGGGMALSRPGSGNGNGMLSSKFPNLKDFLPGGKNDPRRGLAGGGADGITGPNGPSLWEKISTRYRANQPKLLP